MDATVSLSGSQAGVDGRLFDVAIIGGGIAGAAAAVLLGRSGVDAALIDLHETFPPDFRADKVAGEQIGQMKRLGLFAGLVKSSARSRTTINIRRGRIVDRKIGEEYNLPYEDLVNAVRREIPERVARVVGRVADIEASDDTQRVILSDGRRIDARLVILATGNGQALRAKLGVVRRILRENHSVSLGFDLKPVGHDAFDFEALTCYGGAAHDCVDYISLFPFRRGLRANLFVYRDQHDPWLKSFAADPAGVLLQTLPGLAPWLGAFEVVGKVQMRPVDLYETEGAARAGVALVGDAYRSGCPSVGHGLSRAFTDVEQLCLVHIPRWLATPGMGAEKISEFYDDPVKRACGARAAHAAEYRRAATIGRGLRWHVHRRRVFLQRRIRSWLSSRAAMGGNDTHAATPRSA
jgi:2-polyprenyl-6-methoxyphenol hydroxylase-like FAD-dependent oxidoreductase